MSLFDNISSFFTSNNDKKQQSLQNIDTSPLPLDSNTQQDTSTSIPSPIINDSQTQQLTNSQSSDATPSTQNEQLSTTDANTNKIKPILLENFSNEYTQISTQDTFDGFRLEANKQVTPSLLTSHTLIIGTQLNQDGAIYQFGPTFTSPDNSTFLMARTSFDGNVMARFLKSIGNYKLKYNFNSSTRQEMKQNNSYEMCLEHVGNYSTQTMQFIWQKGWILGGSYSRMFLPNFHLGTHLTYLPSNNFSFGILAARYSIGDNVFSCHLSRQSSPSGSPFSSNAETIHSAKIQFSKKITDRLSMGTEYEVSENKESSLKYAFEYLFRNARIQGLIDSGGKVSVTTQDYSGLGISGTSDFFKGDYKFGLVMHLSPPPPE